VTLFEKKNCIAGLLRQRHTGFQKRAKWPIDRCIG
jgi:hypothetical protein